MEYSLPYILLVLFFVAISTLQLGISFDDKSRKYLNNLLIVTYVIFFGFRGFIATDWITYYSFYKTIPNDLLLAIDKSFFEPGFVIYSFLIKKLFVNYETFQLINTLTNVVLLNIFFKRYLSPKYFAIGFTVFLVFFGYVFEINLLRNFKSLLIFLLSLRYLQNREWVKYYLCVFLALMFHWTSIIFIPLYFFLHKKIDLKIFIGIFAIGTLIYIFQLEYIKPILLTTSKFLPEDMADKVVLYVKSDNFGGSYGLSFGYFERTFITFLILLYYKNLTKDPGHILYVNSFLIFISFYLYLSEVSILIVRMASIFAYSYWILIPLILLNMQRNFKPFLFSFIVLLAIVKIHMATNYIFYDYDSFLTKSHKSYETRYKIVYENEKILKNK